MGRKPTPDGRRVPVSFKLTEAEAALIDSLRGETERGVWLRQAAVAVAHGRRDSGILQPALDALNQAMRPDTTAQRRINAAIYAEAVRECGEPATENCKHLKVCVKGVCPDCQEWAVKS